MILQDPLDVLRCVGIAADVARLIDVTGHDRKPCVAFALSLEATGLGDDVFLAKIEDLATGNAFPAAAGKGAAVISCVVGAGDVLPVLGESGENSSVSTTLPPVVS